MMTREEAEDIVVAVEADCGEYYGISKARYAEALLILQEEGLSGESLEPTANG